jgi:TonB-linked SusC/RagA family outer membrane protein
MYKNFTTQTDRPRGHVQSILRVMRIITILLFGAMMQVTAASKAQKITLNESNADIRSVFQSIRAQSGYDFVFDRKLMELAKPVSVKMTNASLSEALKKCFSNQVFAYTIEDKTIIIRERNFLDDLSSYFAPIDVMGLVTDENGQPLPGVIVKVKGANKTTYTGTNGRFYIQTDDENQVLLLSYVGYKTKEVIAASKIEVKMELDPAKLDEVQVIGYGTTTRRTNTGSQVGIKAEDISKQPVTNLLQAAAGQLAGVTITQSNGMPGAGINVQIRGANGIGVNGIKPNRPLYIIDGVPFLSEPINTASFSLTSGNTGLPSAEGRTSPMNSINPSDIESLEVLKDADATAIYGSRGGNGVVLITTKKGKAGKTRFNLNASTGVSKVGHFVEMLGTQEYLALRRKAFSNRTIRPEAPNVTNATDLLVWDQNADNDFLRQMIGGSARTHDLSGSLSGGDATTNFYISGTYHKEGNVYPGDQGYQRGGANFNLNHTSLNQRFALNFSTIYSTDKNDISTTDLASWAYFAPPNFPLYNPNGALNWDGGIGNPMAYQINQNDNRTSNLLSNLALKYTILKGLDIKTSLGYSKTDMTQIAIRPLIAENPIFASSSGSASYVYNFTNNYIVEPQLSYSAKVWKGTLNALMGGSYQFKQSKMPYSTTASGFTSDDFLRSVSAASIVNTTSASIDYKYASLFGRVNYNLADKYILNLNFRRDGSSRFGPNYKFGNFGSVGAAWIFSEEAFLKNRLNWFSFGKLRGSYGVVGSDEIDDYGYLDTYTNSTYLFGGSTGLIPSRLPNPNFRWEQTKKLDLGIELAFLNDRLSLSASYYRNRTSNQLVNLTVSTQTGFSGYQSNLPAAVQNSGVELTLNSTNIKTKTFRWTTSFNISQNRNKLLSFPDIERSSYFTTYIVGNPISSYYTFQSAGIDPATNLPTFTNFDGAGLPAAPSFGFAATGRGDRYFVGTAFPKFFGGITNAVTYKGLTLDFTFQFVKQQGRSLMNASYNPPGYFANMAKSVVDEYLALGSQDFLVTGGTRGPAGSAAFNAYSNYASSDAAIVDASFIRLKNVNLSYAIPTKWISKNDNQNVRVYLQGQNLMTITGYKGFDPESQGIVTPPLRTIIAGFQFTF